MDTSNNNGRIGDDHLHDLQIENRKTYPNPKSIMTENKQKIVITNFQSDINDWIEKGWRITSVVAGNVAISPSPKGFSANDVEHGKFCFVLER